MLHRLWFNFGEHSLGDSHIKTFLDLKIMYKFFHTFQWRVLWTWMLMSTTITNSWLHIGRAEDLGKSCGRVRWRIAGPRDNRECTERPTESTKVDPWGLPETEPSNKEQAQAGPTPPPPNVTDVQLGLTIVWPQWEKMHLVLQWLDVPGWGDTQVGHPPSQKRMGVGLRKVAMQGSPGGGVNAIRM